MKKLLLVAILPALAACSRQSAALDDHLENPLFAERYAEELVEHMVELTIQNDPLLQDERRKEIADDARRQWFDRARLARQKQREGVQGVFLPMKTFVTGDALYVDDTLYIGTTFDVTPGPALHLFLTTAVDPRDVPFPDPAAFDLGVLRSPYGAQAYAVPRTESSLPYRTVVLFDTELERLHGFAQMSQ